MQMKAKTTMKDIAEALGLSIVSISKALTGKEGVSETLRETIVKKAEEMGYIHPKAAKDEQKRNTIGILVSSRFFSDTEFYAYLNRFLIVKCSENQRPGMLEVISEKDEEDNTPPQILSNGQVGGIIVMGKLSESYLEKLASFSLPTVYLDFYLGPINENCIISDSIGGAYAAVSYLIGMGHEKIAFIGSITATSSIMDRYLGYLKAHFSAGIEPDRALCIPDRDIHGQFIDIALPTPRPTAFFCNCDPVARALIEKLQSKGIRVPEDVSVIGFDDSRYATASFPPLTSVRVDIERMASLAVSRLLSLEDGKAVEGERSVVPCTLILRDTVMKRG